MPNFTADEQAKINAQMKPPADRPSYFSATNQRLQQIGSDFEAFLILQRMSQKQISMDWIDRALDIEADNEDRDALIIRYLDNIQEDANTRIDELDDKLQNFNTFMTTLFEDDTNDGGPSRWSTVAELNLFVQSLQKPLDKLTVQRDQAFHDSTLVNLVRERVQNEITDESSQNELDSWNSVLSAYNGQPG